MMRAAAELLALYLRRTPLDRGRWRLIPSAVRWAGRHLPSDGFRTVTTRHGFRMRLALGDWLGRRVFATGEYEPATTAVLLQRLRPGDVFVDVGANVGYFTLLAARAVGPTGRVLAFEPVEPTRRQLLENVSRNRAAHVEVREEAVSDRAGEATIHLGPADHRGLSSLLPPAGPAATATVRTARLDDLVSAYPAIRLVKIDVEGAEPAALAGMADVLRTRRPDLVVEMTDAFLARSGSSVRAVRDHLAGFGYRMAVITHDGPVAVADGTALPDQFNALFTCGPAEAPA